MKRRRDEEQMDDPALDPAVYAAVLADLGRVNRWTFAARPTLAFLRRAAAGRGRLRLLDVGFGQGDMLRAIAGWARGQGVDLELVGVDLNPKSVAVAAAATPPDMAIDYRAGDYRGQGEFDLVISSLVAHHMSDSELLDLLGWMEARAARGWLVNDLHRHRIVREDGRLSIERSFRPGEWRDIMAKAGIPTGAAVVRRRFPFRLCVERLR
jgi:hypothetical protein